MKLFPKPLTTVLGLTAAFAACGAIPIAMPAILAVAGMTSASLGAGSVAAVIGAAAVSLFAVALWQRARRKAAAKKSYGCDTGCDWKACL